MAKSIRVIFTHDLFHVKQTEQFRLCLTLLDSNHFMSSFRLTCIDSDFDSKSQSLFSIELAFPLGSIQMSEPKEH